MLVCFVSHTSAMGGAERSMMDLIEALTLRGIDCHVIVPDRGDLTKTMDVRGVPYFVSYFRPWCRAAGAPLWDRLLKKPFVHIVRAAQMARTLRRCKCDIVVTNTFTVCEGAVAAWLLGIPHVTHVREFGDPGYGLHFELGVHLSMRILNHLSKGMVFNSRALARHFESELPASRAHVVYNAVVVPALAPTRAQAARERCDGTVVCLLVGSILKSKGQEDAVRAVHELVRRGVFVRLRIVGGGESGKIDRLRQLIHALEIETQVELVGQVADPYPYYAGADVVLVCSHREAFARVPIEAMKIGRPVIAAHGGGTGEQIRDGFNGSLYPPGDWTALADRIQAFCADRQAACEMAGRAQEWATRTFNVERYGDEMLAVLLEIVAPSNVRLSTAEERRSA